jgi:hypothetical protein
VQPAAVAVQAARLAGVGMHDVIVAFYVHWPITQKRLRARPRSQILMLYRCIDVAMN